MAAEEPKDDTTSSARRVDQPVDPPDDAGEEVVPDDVDAASPTKRANKKRVKDPKAKHDRKIEKQKLRFSFRLIAGCLLLLVVLGSITAWVPPKGDSIDAVIDLLRTVILMVLGYVFGNVVNTTK